MAQCSHLYHFKRQVPFQTSKKPRHAVICIGVNRATHREEICDDGLIWKPIPRKRKPKKKQQRAKAE
jgi:hypothetical protein